MGIGLVFWILMLLWLVFGLWQAWPVGGTPVSSGYQGWYPLGSTVMLFLLFLLLGWAAFGPPIRG